MTVNTMVCVVKECGESKKDEYDNSNIHNTASVVLGVHRNTLACGLSLS